jgi:predicted alpha/beta hydrolase family esterase
VTPAAIDAEQLRELDEDVRRAWNDYIEQLRELSGHQYEQAEHERWTELQDELKTLEHRRQQLTSE